EHVDVHVAVAYVPEQEHPSVLVDSLDRSRYSCDELGKPSERHPDVELSGDPARCDGLSKAITVTPEPLKLIDVRRNGSVFDPGVRERFDQRVDWRRRVATFNQQIHLTGLDRPIETKTPPDKFESVVEEEIRGCKLRKLR